ncbi:hypothetical protein K5549_021491, partial [Capra hircus]
RCFNPVSLPQVFWNLSFELAKSGRGAALQGETERTGSVTEQGEGVRRQSRQSPTQSTHRSPEVLPPSLEHASNSLITGKRD